VKEIGFAGLARAKEKVGFPLQERLKLQNSLD
jgi:hypothetical protein